jgi:hypothetical protein
LKASLERVTKNRLKRNVSAETRAKLLAGTRTAIPVEITDIETGLTTLYPSARRAAECLNISNSTVMDKIKQNTKTLQR